MTPAPRLHQAPRSSSTGYQVRADGEPGGDIRLRIERALIFELQGFVSRFSSEIRSSHGYARAGKSDQTVPGRGFRRRHQPRGRARRARVLAWSVWMRPVSYTHLTLPTSDLV